MTTKQGFKVLQINMNHCRAASATTAKIAREYSIDIILFQDSYIGNNRLYGFPIGWQILLSKDKKAGIALTTRFPFNFLPSTDTAAYVNISSSNQNFIIGFQYIRPNADIEQGLAEWEKSQR